MASPQALRVVTIAVDGTPTVVELPAPIRPGQMQDLIGGGYYTAMPAHVSTVAGLVDVLAWYDEDADHKDLPVNGHASQFLGVLPYTVLRGTVAITGPADASGGETSIPDDVLRLFPR